MRALREFIAAGAPHRGNDVLRAQDPRPFLVETLKWFAERAALGVRRIVPGQRRAALAKDS
jgi:hypothetical protein